MKYKYFVLLLLLCCTSITVISSGNEKKTVRKTCCREVIRECKKSKDPARKNSEAFQFSPIHDLLLFM